VELNLPARTRRFATKCDLHRGNYPQEMRVPNPETDLTKEQMLLWHRSSTKRMRATLAEGIRRTRLVDHATFSSVETSRAGTPPPLAFSHHGRPGDLHVR
jgi:hypothetical protein